MKKVLIGFGITLVVFVGLVLLLTIDFNRFNKSNVYVQVPQEELAAIDEFKLSDGEIMRRYIYTVPAINEAGENVAVEFSASKPLREGAYLVLYLKKGTTEVTSYDEVQRTDLPKRVKEQF